MADSKPLTRLPQPHLSSPRPTFLKLHWGTLFFIGPLLLYLFAFMVLPSIAVLIGAFKSDSGGFTWQYVKALTEPQYVLGLQNTLTVSFFSALLGTIFGAVLAWLALGPNAPTWLRRPLLSFAGVASNFAGIPLALAFLVTLGSTGIVTRLLSQMGIDLYGSGFSLFNVWGLVLVYLYFQVPLMVILFAPALAGIRQEWFEASDNLGVPRSVFWKRVGLPLLTPALLGCGTMLFGNAFATYATPYALTSGQVPLLPLQIAAVMTGNVMSEPQMGRAIALLIIVIMAITAAIYTYFDRLNNRWRK